MSQYIPPTELIELRLADVITQAEYDVLLLRAKDFSHWQIALTLDLSKSAVRDRERNAHRKIELHRRPRKDAA